MKDNHLWFNLNNWLKKDIGPLIKHRIKSLMQLMEEPSIEEKRIYNESIARAKQIEEDAIRMVTEDLQRRKEWYDKIKKSGD